MRAGVDLVEALLFGAALLPRLPLFVIVEFGGVMRCDVVTVRCYGVRCTVEGDW